MTGMQWHQPDHMQTICTSLQTDNHTNTSSLNFFAGRMLFLVPSQQCQSTGSAVKSQPTNHQPNRNQANSASYPLWDGS